MTVNALSKGLGEASGRLASTDFLGDWSLVLGTGSATLEDLNVGDYIEWSQPYDLEAGVNQIALTLAEFPADNPRWEFTVRVGAKVCNRWRLGSQSTGARSGRVSRREIVINMVNFALGPQTLTVRLEVI